MLAISLAMDAPHSLIDYFGCNQGRYIMTLDQFYALAALARLDMAGKAHRGAILVLVKGQSQTDAARAIGCAQSTVSAAVRRIKAAQRLANQGAKRY